MNRPILHTSSTIRRRVERELLTFLVLLFSMSAVAQLPTVTVKVPNVKRFVRILDEDVTLHRLPNATSGKVMVWSSDAYTKLFFSDTEGEKYTANDENEAEVTPYHPVSDYLYMVSNENPEPQNGWYQILIMAEEYMGKQTYVNSKMAWVSASYCEVIDVDENKQAQERQGIPVGFKWDDDSESNVPEEVMSFSEGLKVSSIPGAYQGVSMTIKPEYSKNELTVNVLNHIGNFIYCSRPTLQLLFGTQTSPTPTFRIIKEEVPLEGAEPLMTLQVSLSEQNDIKKTMLDMFKILINPTLEPCKMFYEVAWEHNKIPTNEVYFLGKDGKTYSFSYNPDMLTEYGYQNYTVKK